MTLWSFVVSARIDDSSHSARLFILCDQVAGITAFRLVGIEIIWCWSIINLWSVIERE